MPTTVANLISLLDVKLWGYQDSISEAQKILALNAGKHKTWLALHTAGREESAHWFAESDTANITAGTRTVNLTADVHDVLSVERADANLHSSGFHKAEWRNQREDSGTKVIENEDNILWLIAGSNPAVLEVGYKFASDLIVTVYATKKLGAWTATGDDADVIPEAYHDCICNYATWTLLTGLQDPQSSTLLWQAWQADLALIMGAAGDRQVAAGTVTREDYASR